MPSESPRAGPTTPSRSALHNQAKPRDPARINKWRHRKDGLGTGPFDSTCHGSTLGLPGNIWYGSRSHQDRSRCGGSRFDSCRSSGPYSTGRPCRTPSCRSTNSLKGSNPRCSRSRLRRSRFFRRTRIPRGGTSPGLPSLAEPLLSPSKLERRLPRPG